MNKDYSRNLIGYGANPPNPQWPGNARVAVSFVLNYEEGGERCLLHGDDESEAFFQRSRQHSRSKASVTSAWSPSMSMVAERVCGVFFACSMNMKFH